MISLLQPGSMPELGGFLGGIFQALFDPNPFSCFEIDAIEADIANGRVEGLVATTVMVIYIFPNDFPVVKLEDLLSQDVIYMKQPIENKSDRIMSM